MDPVYLGFSTSLMVMVCKFFVELYKVVLNVSHYNNEEIILSLQLLVNFILMVGLLIIVILSGCKTLLNKLI
ncbi:hypothetical protein MC47_009860 [Citrobacter freundii]|nr:hypothetical protein MC47_009860 [Citrobacter freundii]